MIFCISNEKNISLGGGEACSIISQYDKLIQKNITVCIYTTVLHLSVI